MARLSPLPIGAVPELKEVFEKMQASGHFVPNSLGFMNRFNDTMATPLEEEPIHVAEKHIAQHGWKLGKHGR